MEEGPPPPPPQRCGRGGRKGAGGNAAPTSAGTDCCPPPPGSPSLPDNGIDRGLHWRRWEELVATLQLTAAEDNNVDVFGDSKTTRTAMNATTYLLTCDIEFVHPGGSTSSSRRSRSGSTVRGWVIGRRSPGDATGGALSSNDIVGIHIGGQDAGNGRWGIKQAAAGHRRCRELVWHCDNQQGQQQQPPQARRYACNAQCVLATGGGCWRPRTEN